MYDVFIRKYLPFTIFEPFLSWLISSDVEVSSNLGYVIEILYRINPYFSYGLSLRGTKQSIVTRSIKPYLLHLIISSYWIRRDKRFTLWMFHKMSLSELTPEIDKFPKHSLIFRKRNSRKIDLEKLLVGLTITQAM